MKLKRLLLLSILVLSASAFIGCTNSNKKKSSASTSQEVTFNIQVDPLSLDPRKARRLGDLNLLKTFNEGLYRSDQNGELKEALVKSVTISNDKKTYEFELKETLWSNGDPLTAHDFIYSWKTSLDKDFPAPYASILYPLKNAKAIKQGLMPTSMLGVKANGDYTLIVELEEATPFFKELLTIPVFFAVNESVVKENSNWHLEPDQFICNGPFTIKSWRHKDQLIAVKNKRYWDEKSVKLQKLNMVMIDPDTAFKMYENGELNWAGSPYSNLPPDAINHLNKNNQIEMNEALTTYMLKTNIEAFPLNNKNLRKSIAYAINRKDIVDHVLFKGGAVATAFVPSCLNVQEEGYFKDGNTQKARELFELALDELSLTKETLPPLTITYHATEKSHKIISAVQDQLNQVFGISVQLDPLESKVCIDKITRGNYQMVFRDWTADYKDPISFLEIFKTKHVGTNNTNWESLDYISAINASYHCDSTEERFAKLNEAEKILMDDLPAIPIYHNKFLHLQDEKLKGVVLTETGTIDFKWAYIEE